MWNSKASSRGSLASTSSSNCWTVVLLCRFLQLQDTLSFRFCRCRTLTGSCRAAPAATDPGTRRIGAARRTNATPTSASVWRSTSWRCPRPGPAASAPPPRPCSVGIPFLYATPRATKPGSCCRSASRGRWVQKFRRWKFFWCLLCHKPHVQILDERFRSNRVQVNPQLA